MGAHQRLNRAQLELRLAAAEARAQALERSLKNKTLEVVLLLDQIQALKDAFDKAGLEVEFKENS